MRGGLLDEYVAERSDRARPGTSRILRPGTCGCQADIRPPGPLRSSLKCSTAQVEPATPTTPVGGFV
jgi:hypothetical protein